MKGLAKVVVGMVTGKEVEMEEEEKEKEEEHLSLLLLIDSMDGMK